MPLTVIRASAGSGKTFQLAMSFIRILLEGELADQPRNPAAILATTFTRAAAGEILERVLRLIAEAVLEQSRRDFLEKQIGLPLSANHCARILASLAAHVDRLSISTMDAFFGQIAKAFSSDLGLAPDWTMAVNEAEADLLRRTLHALLNATDHRSLGAALWTFRRGVISSMLDALRDLAPEFSAMRTEENPDAIFTEPEPRRWSAEEVAHAMHTLGERSAWIPRTKAERKPLKTWETALDKIAESLRPGSEAIPLILQTLAQKILLGGDYYKQPVPPELRDTLRPLIERASAALRDRHLAREDALRWLGAHYASHRRTENFSGGTYTFGDIAAMVTAAALDCDDLYFRIGTRYEHVLFDEFQDTSRMQFQFFKPVVEEIGSTGGEVLIVGDEKQAIYGWRGSDRALMHEPLRELAAQIGAGGEKTLDQSFRSSPAVLAAVNRTFMRLRTPWLGEDAKERDALDSAGREWAADFPEHSAADRVKDQPGRVRLLKVANDPDGDAASHKQALVAETLRLVGDHLAADRQRKIAVLLRKNSLMPRLIASLRSAHPDVDVSGEGGNPLTDSRAVEIILGIFTWLDHPGNSAAHHLITHSAFAEVFGFPVAENHDEENDTRGAEDELARTLRHRIMEHGCAELLREWIRHPAFSAACGDHDLQRCEQLLDVAREFDAHGPRRLSEFVTHVRTRRVERPGGPGVRVMTIHASKGLEFEAVVLVDIDAPSGGRGTPILHDPDGAFHIVPTKEQAPLMGLDDLVQRNVREDFMEELSVLYVAMTRARSFLDIVLRAESKAPVATLLRAALIPVGEDGVAENFDGKPALAESEKPVPAAIGSDDPGIASTARTNAESKKRASKARGKISGGTAVSADAGRPEAEFARTIHVTPSGSAEYGGISITRLLSPANRAARQRGDLVHAWLREIEWLESAPDTNAWIDSAAEIAPGLSSRDIAAWAHALADEVRDNTADLHRALTRPAARAGETVELWRERRFAIVGKADGRSEVLSGSFDRVVLWRDANGKALRAEITDFKTDRFDSPEERQEIETRYAAQLDAYLSALTILCPELNACDVKASLTFVRAHSSSEIPR
jgi:ATP-dependent exoDNAse (exonuclease V) beta subunit